MQIASDAPRRPALRYYGGKWNLARWIIGYFPPHKNYVEPCGGAASVLLQKPRSPLETYNDLDGSVVNFFRVLRDRPEELIRKIQLTPWAREEYELSQEPIDEPIEKARRFFVKMWMGISASTSDDIAQSGFRMSRGGDTRDWILYFEDIERIAQRFVGVQIEHKRAQEIIPVLDGHNTLFYFDPPYLSTERTKKNWYSEDWNGDSLHIEAADLLRACAGYVVVSGYACPLYADLYEQHGWKRVDREAQTNSGGKRIESLWLSPRTWDALQDGYGLPLFGGV